MAKGKSNQQGNSPFRGLMVRINEQGWKDLKILAAEEGVTLNALAVEALNDLLRKYRKKSSIENPLISTRKN